MAKKLLDDNIRKQVRELFGEIKEPVVVLLFGSKDRERCQYCEDTRQLLEEVVELSEKLSLKVYDIDDDAETAKTFKVDAVPTIVMAGNDEQGVIDYGVRYKGIPSGHEFATLVNDLVLVSKRDSGLSSATRDFLRSLTKPVHLQVFVTPT
jgi:glutaredoxin-like protein